MLVYKNFGIMTEVKNVKTSEWDFIDMVPVDPITATSRCDATFWHGLSESSIVDLYTDDDVFPTDDAIDIAEGLCDALGIETPNFMIPTRHIRNHVEKKAVLSTSGWLDVERKGKRGIRRSHVGKRLNSDGRMDVDGQIEIPCTCNGALRPFRTIGIDDVWKAIRPYITLELASKLQCDRRHVRVSLVYRGSLDIRG